MTRKGGKSDIKNKKRACLTVQQRLKVNKVMHKWDLPVYVKIKTKLPENKIYQN